MKARDEAGNEDATPASQTFTADIGLPSGGPLALTATRLSDGERGVAYNSGLGISGGSSPYIINVISGSLPSGLSIVGQNIAGTPAAAGKRHFTIKVTDQLGASVSRKYTVNINKSLTISTSTLKASTVGRNYSAVLKAAGGTKPYIWSWLSGAIPGLSLNTATGQFTGVPTTPGTYNPIVQVTDPLTGAAQRTLTLQVR